MRCHQQKFDSVTSSFTKNTNELIVFCYSNWKYVFIVLNLSPSTLIKADKVILYNPTYLTESVTNRTGAARIIYLRHLSLIYGEFDHSRFLNVLDFDIILVNNVQNSYALCRIETKVIIYKRTPLPTALLLTGCALDTLFKHVWWSRIWLIIFLNRCPERE